MCAGIHVSHEAAGVAARDQAESTARTDGQQAERQQQQRVRHRSLHWRQQICGQSPLVLQATHNSVRERGKGNCNRQTRLPLKTEMQNSSLCKKHQAQKINLARNKRHATRACGATVLATGCCGPQFSSYVQMYSHQNCRHACYGWRPRVMLHSLPLMVKIVGRKLRLVEEMRLRLRK